MRERHILIEINGIVQGVGFRPFVYTAAQKHGLQGWVYNHGAGVSIAVQGPGPAIEDFLEDLRSSAPPLARIDTLKVIGQPLAAYTGFTIRKSGGQAAGVRLIPPDIALCDACRAELYDSRDRRFQYPFINCTNCGPRFTIIAGLPYDRPSTTMKDFALCPACAREYDDPGDRRFHAQPNACALCGPAYCLSERNGVVIQGDAIGLAGRFLRQGRILAIKGIGGYHLACDARNMEAVERLRLKKGREAKPLAVMAPSVDYVRQICRLSPAEEVLLTDPARPIVLLRKSDGYALASGVAPDNPYLGVILPYAPVHHLLCGAELPLVMTSGNQSDAPIAYRDKEALSQLAGIAEYFLTHNREILRSCDDSVVRIFEDAPLFIRRSRGYAPLPVMLSRSAPPLLAVGAEQKNVFALTKGTAVFLSQHIGDLENLETLEAFTRGIMQLQDMLDINPRYMAHDLHPEYLSTKFAREAAVPLVGVQHHHAHIAAVMAEYDLRSPVIGVALDGTGYGEDGHLWGGEFLVAGEASYQRRGQLEYLPLIGGKAAIKHPWRIAYGYQQKLLPGSTPLTLPAELTSEQRLVLAKMLTQGINTPLTSSMGRLFDAVAAALGLRLDVSYEGQAAVELGLLAEKSGNKGTYSYGIDQTGDRYIVRLAALWAELVDDIQNKRSPADIAAVFHNSIARLIADMSGKIARDTGLREVALSGGVFQNHRLLTHTADRLREEGFTVYIPRAVPPNDGGIALGQAYVAAARLRA